MKEYVTIGKSETVIENVIEKSRFIASAMHVETAAQALDFVNSKRNSTTTLRIIVTRTLQETKLNSATMASRREPPECRYTSV